MPLIQGEVDVEFEGDEFKRFVAVTEDKVYVSTSENDLENLLSDKKLKKVVYDSKPVFSFADKKGIDAENIVFKEKNKEIDKLKINAFKLEKLITLLPKFVVK